MQQTRDLILKYLKTHGQATVDELAQVLGLTPVTVRHHLDILRSEELVSEPVIRRRSSPGRPQYAFGLTGKASQHFPKNYCDLTGHLLREIKLVSSSQAVETLFQGVADRFAAEAPRPILGEPMTDRLDRAVAFLNEQGYVAHWEPAPEGYALHTCNCPYEGLAADHPELCGMDLTLVGNLLGFTPQRMSRVVEGASSCSYFIPAAGVEGQPQEGGEAAAEMAGYPQSSAGKKIDWAIK